MSGLRDGSSRFNSIGRSRRQSIGIGGLKGDATTPQKERRGLIDSSGLRENAFSSSLGRSSSVPRRQSLGGDSFRSGTPVKDRRAMLEAWRQARAGNRAPEEAENKKRVRNDPPLPPSSSGSFTPGSRKIARTNNIHNEQETIGSSTIAFYDDEEEHLSRGSSLLSSRTSMAPRGKLGSARRHSLLGRNIPQQQSCKFFVRFSFHFFPTCTYNFRVFT